MGNFNVIKVDRTKIVISGEFSLEKANRMFGEVCKTSPASMQAEYDEDSDQTILKFYPCVIQDVEYDVEHGNKKSLCLERRIVMLGAIPSFVDIVEQYWVPTHKTAKKQKSAMQWVVMYPPKRISMPYGKYGTELGFIVDFRCERTDISEALDTAAQIMSEKLRLIVQDVNPSLMLSARLLDEISMEMAERLHKLEDDETTERMTKMGLRRFDTDDLIFGSNSCGASTR